MIRNKFFGEEDVQHIDDVLRLLTVDGSQKHESMMVFLDGSFQQGGQGDIGKWSSSKLLIPVTNTFIQAS